MFFSKASAKPAESEARYRELRRTMQDIVIAHAAICFKHMNQEQLVAAQAEWAQAIKGKGWAPFFADDGPPLSAPGVAATEAVKPDLVRR